MTSSMTTQAPRGTCLARMRRDLQRGLSMVESLAAVAALSVSISTVLPDLTKFGQRARMNALVSQVQSDLQAARIAAVAADEVLRIDFADDGQGGCYVLHNGSAGQCSCKAPQGVPQCSGGAVARSAFAVGVKTGPQLRSNVGSLAFSPSVGTVTPAGTVRVESEGLGTVHLVVNVMGRVRTCSPTGLAGYRPC